METTALAATLSLWTDLRPAFDAVYTGLHREALNRRYDWFERTGHPNHVFWWVSDGVTPTWRDGVSRLEHLRGHGSAPHAFTFRHPFAPEGTPTSIKGVEPKSDQVRWQGSPNDRVRSASCGTDRVRGPGRQGRGSLRPGVSGPARAVRLPAPRTVAVSRRRP